VRQALKLDPGSAIIAAEMGCLSVFGNRHDEAMVWFKRTLTLDPMFPLPFYYFGWCYERKRRFDEAIAAFLKARTFYGDHPVLTCALACVYAAAGRRSEARQTLATIPSPIQQTSSFHVATVLAALGEDDEAFAWLETAYHNRDSQLVSLKVEPHFERLRTDPRFNDLLRRVGLPIGSEVADRPTQEYGLSGDVPLSASSNSPAGSPNPR